MNYLSVSSVIHSSKGFALRGIFGIHPRNGHSGSAALCSDAVDRKQGWDIGHPVLQQTSLAQPLMLQILLECDHQTNTETSHSLRRTTACHQLVPILKGLSCFRIARVTERGASASHCFVSCNLLVEVDLCCYIGTRQIHLRHPTLPPI